MVRDVIVKHYSKFWVNQQSRKIEGESCIQLLTNGQAAFTYDSLLYELKEAFEMDDITTSKDGMYTPSLAQNININILDFKKEDSPPSN